MLTIGTHMSIADGIVKTAQNVIEIGANTMQIFSRNPRGSGFKNYSQEEKEAFEEIRLQNHFGPLMAHAPANSPLWDANVYTLTILWSSVITSLITLSFELISDQ